VTGTLISDFTVTGEALEEELDLAMDVNIEPRCHPMVLHDSAKDLGWSREAPKLKACTGLLD
jgi:hypothetical protein